MTNSLDEQIKENQGIISRLIEGIENVQERLSFKNEEEKINNKIDALQIIDHGRYVEINSGFNEETRAISQPLIDSIVEKANHIGIDTDTIMKRIDPSQLPDYHSEEAYIGAEKTISAQLNWSREDLKTIANHNASLSMEDAKELHGDLLKDIKNAHDKVQDVIRSHYHSDHELQADGSDLGKTVSRDERLNE